MSYQTGCKPQRQVFHVTGLMYALSIEHCSVCLIDIIYNCLMCLTGVSCFKLTMVSKRFVENQNANITNKLLFSTKR